MEDFEKNEVYKQFKDILTCFKQLSNATDGSEFAVFRMLCEEYYDIVKTTSDSVRSILMIKMLMEEIQLEIDNLTVIFIDDVSDANQSEDKLKPKLSYKSFESPKPSDEKEEKQLYESMFM